MKSKPKNPIPQKREEQAEEWDLTQGMGIFPPDISLTQNIGCVGNKKEKQNTRSNSKQKKY
jgi:hypothetical protein